MHRGTLQSCFAPVGTLHHAWCCQGTKPALKVLFSQESCVHMLPASQAVLQRDLIVQATPLSLKQQCNNGGAVQYLRPLLDDDNGRAVESPHGKLSAMVDRRSHGVEYHAQPGHVRRLSLPQNSTGVVLQSKDMLVKLATGTALSFGVPRKQ